MSGREWQPGDVASIHGTIVLAHSRMPGLFTYADGSEGRDHDGDARPLVVIDPEDREQVERLDAAIARVVNNYAAGHCGSVDALQSGLREFANPTPVLPYTTDTSPVPPWPTVAECQSSHREGHECPQCAWFHEHDWVAWNAARFERAIPIRCSKCGGRKCDWDLCALQRHHTGEHVEVTP